LGNITALVNSRQYVVARYLYDPFGNTLSLGGPLADANVYRFGSQEFHANSGLTLYLRRAYAANLQRFLNRDPTMDLGGLNLCRAGRKLYNFFDPPRQLREGLHMLPLLSLLAGQPELAALFSLTDAALYASEGNIKGTILAGLGALPIVGVIGKAAGEAEEA